jgi:hypothetical protein
MKEVRLKCDVVGCRLYDATSFSVGVETYTDGAGSSDTRITSFELCPRHQKILLDSFLTRHIALKGTQTRDFLEEFLGYRPEVA